MKNNILITTDDKCVMWRSLIAQPTNIIKGKHYITNQLVQLIEDRNVKSEYLFVFKNGSKGHVLKNLIAIYHKPTQQKLYKQQWTNSIKNFWTNYKLNVKYSIYTGIIDNNNEYTRIRLRNTTKNELT